MIGPAGIKSVYRKTHLFFNEKNYFIPGNNFELVEIYGVKVGILVCIIEINPLEALNKQVTDRNNIFEDRRKELYTV